MDWKRDAIPLVEDASKGLAASCKDLLTNELAWWLRKWPQLGGSFVANISQFACLACETMNLSHSASMSNI